MITRQLEVVVLILAVCSLRGVSSQSKCTRGDIVFVVDQSGSIVDANPKNGSWDNWVLVKNFVNNIIASSTVGYSTTHFGLVTFGNIGVVRFRLTDYLDVNSLRNAVNSVPPGNGQTNLYQGLNFARTVVLSEANNARSDVTQAIIVITDGFANKDSEKTIPEAEACFAQGIKIYAVGVTDLISEPQLKAVSSPPHQKGTNYWTTPDFTSLSSIVQNLQSAACPQPKPDAADCRTLDLAFAIDVPDAQADYNSVKNYIKRFITNFLIIGSDRVRVSIVTFDGRSATVLIPLNGFYDEDKLQLAIDGIKFVASGNADPTYAFQTLRTSVFTTAGGGRGSGVKSIAVILLNNRLPNALNAINAMKLLTAQGVRVVAVGQNLNVAFGDLSPLTAADQDVITSVAFSALSSTQQALYSAVCNAGGYVRCPVIADVALVIDYSTSIVAASGAYNNWQYILGFASSIVSSFPIGTAQTRVGLVGFSTSASVVFYLDRYTNRNDLLAAIKNFQHVGGETNIASALRVSRTDLLTSMHGARAGVPKIVILMTDGFANYEADRTIPEANLTRAAGVEIFTIGMTDKVDVNQLKAISSYPPDTHFFYVSDFSKLSTILDDLIQRSCNSVPTVATQSTATTTTTRGPVTTTTTTSTTTRPTTTSTTTSPTTTSTTTSPTTTSTTTRPTTTSTTKGSTSTSTTTGSTTTSTTTRPISTTTTSMTTTTTRAGQTTTTTMPTTTTTRRSTTPGDGTCGLPLDLVLILDESTSIVSARGEYANWYTYILGFAKAIVDAFTISPSQTHVSVVKFSNSAYTAFYLTDFSDATQVKKAIDAMDLVGGETNIAAALRVTRTQAYMRGARTGIRRKAFLITDGVANRERNRTIAEADLTKQAGIEIFAIGITAQVNATELRAICSAPADGHYFYASDYSQLTSILKSTISSACNADSVPNPATTTASTRATTRTTLNGNIITADPSNIVSACKNKIDLILILDESTSIVYAAGGYDNWYTSIVGFAKSIANYFTISPSYAQVGAIKFSTSTTVAFYLNRYRDNAGVLEGLSSLDIKGGETNIAAAERLTRTVMLSLANGKRSDAVSVCLFITDGESNKETASTLPESVELKKLCTVFTIGVTSNVKEAELKAITSEPVSNHYYFVSDFRSLPSVASAVMGGMCNAANPERA